MNTRENRITLHRRHCEERRHYLAELEFLAQRLRTDGWLLRGEIERAVAIGNPASAHPLLQRHGRLARSLAAIEGQITAAEDALAAATRELKRHELAGARPADNAGASDRRRPPPRPRPAVSDCSL
jgi:hypothetical protein